MSKEINAEETYDLNYLKRKGDVGEFSFKYFKLSQTNPFYDTIVELKLWLEDIEENLSNKLLNFNHDELEKSSIYIRHHDLYTNIGNKIKEGGYFIYYSNERIKHVSNEEMKKIYPYDNNLNFANG